MLKVSTSTLGHSIHLLTWGSTWRRPTLLAASLSALVMGQLDVETFFHSLAQNRVLMFKRLHSALKLLGVLHHLEREGVDADSQNGNSHPLQIAEISLQARRLLVLLVQLRHLGKLIHNEILKLLDLLQHVGGQEE